MHYHFKAILPLLMVFLVLSINVFNSNFAFAASDSIDSRFQLAQDSIGQAFNLTLSAEKAGANVTDLLRQLNRAAGLLTQAEIALSSGDEVAATNSLNELFPITDNVINAAQSYRTESSASAQLTFEVNVIIAVVGSALLILILFVLWRFVKSKYIKGLSQAKPEVRNK